MSENQKLTIRLSDSDLARLTQYTRKTHLSQSAYLRMLIRGYVPNAYPPEAFVQVAEELHAISGTLSQIADTARLRGEVSAEAYRVEVSKLHTSILSLQSAVTAPQKMEV